MASEITLLKTSAKPPEEHCAELDVKWELLVEYTADLGLEFLD